jgi:hypothetical protein
MINEEDYVELGMACVDVCTTLSWGLNGKPLARLTHDLRSNSKKLRLTYIQPTLI